MNFFCLALFAGLHPPQIFTAAPAAFHFRPRGWCKGAGLLPGKLLGELSAAAQPSPASFSLGSPVPLPDSVHPDHAADLL